MVCLCFCFNFFFFKEKRAYEVRLSVGGWVMGIGDRRGGVLGSILISNWIFKVQKDEYSLVIPGGNYIS